MRQNKHNSIWLGLVIAAGFLLVLILIFSVRRVQDGIQFPTLGKSSFSGYIPAEFEVGEMGTPVYSIPVEVPPGIDGVQPGLSLEYSAITSNGVLGMGWNLKGLTVIKRTGRTIPEDGIKGGINLDSNDRFEINGQRLVAYKDSSGNSLSSLASRNAAYGKNGVEYRTLIESGIRIFSYGNSGYGPSSFMAYGKDGSITEFSITSKASSATTVKIPFVWGATKVNDRNGNYVSLSYLRDSLNGTSIPFQIVYTGNTSGNLLPQRMVEFIPEDRPDTIFNNLGGREIINYHRIKEINTYVDQDGDGMNINIPVNLVHRYRIRYDNSTISGRSRIRSLTLYDNLGDSLPGTTFSWTGSLSRNVFADTLVPLPERFKFLVKQDTTKVKGDYNGDGRIDIALLKQYADSMPVALSGENGLTIRSFFIPVDCRSYLDGPDITQTVADFNGDGLTDIAFFKTTESKVPVLFSNGKNSFSSTIYILPDGWNNIINLKGTKRLSGDFNGDGLADIAAFNTHWKTLPLLLATPNGSFTHSREIIDSLISSMMNAPGAEQQTGDFNGDGLTDITCFVPATISVPIMFSKGNGLFSGTLKALPENIKKLINQKGTRKIIGDYNGDRLHDIGMIVPSTQSVPMAISLGNGTFSGELFPLNKDVADVINGKDVQLFTGDLNGDARLDIAAFRKTDGNIAALFSNSSFQFRDSMVSIPPDIAKLFSGYNTDRFIADFNGDGLIDIAALNPSHSNIPVLYSVNRKTKNNLPDLLINITNGIGATCLISYEPFSQLTSYPPSHLQYPLLSVYSAQYVVDQTKQQSSSLNPSSLSVTDYLYDSVVIDNYRGWRGFAQTTVLDHQNQTRIISHHLLKFPYSGQTYKRVISDLTNTNQCLGVFFNVYDTLQTGSSGSYSIAKMSNWTDHYTKGTYNYTTKKVIRYNSDFTQIRWIHNMADTNKIEDNYYVVFKYGNYPSDTLNFWKAFCPVSEKGSVNCDTNATSWTSGDLFWTKYTYDASMNIADKYSFMDNNGSGIDGFWTGETYQYDAFGNVTLKKTPPNISKDSIINAIVYDPVFHTFPWKITSPKPDPNGKGSSPLVTLLTHDPRFGEMVAHTDPNGIVIYTVPDQGIDGFGRPLVILQALPDSYGTAIASMYEYRQTPAEGYQVLVAKPTLWDNSMDIDSTWITNHTFFDGLARNILQTKNGNSTGSRIASWTTYDLNGRNSKEFLPASIGQPDSLNPVPACPKDSLYTRNVYDNHGVLLQVWAPTGNGDSTLFLKTQYIYDSLDNRNVTIRVPSPENDTVFVQWKIKYGSNGKMEVRSGPYNDNGNKGVNFAVDSFYYDRLGHLIKVTDPLKETSFYGYNSLGLQIWEYRPETDTIRFVFNSNVWPVCRKDANGRTEMKYDNLGRMINKTAFSTSGRVVNNATYIYDDDSISSNGKGHLSKLVLSDVQYSFNYDNNGNVSERRTEFKELNSVFVEKKSIDASGRVYEISYPNGDDVRYVYNYGDNVSAIILNGDTVAAKSAYNSFGLCGKVDFHNGVSSYYKYDQTGRLKINTTEKSAWVHAKFDYNWNHAGKLMNITDLRKSKEDTVRLDQAFSYYPSGRLHTAKGAYGTQTFTYDPAGNVLSDGEFTYTYDITKKHELTGIENKGVSTFTLGYDQVGNLSRKFRKLLNDSENSETEYVFGPEGQLDSVTANSGGIRVMVNSFSYDDAGSRIIKRDSNATTTYYISPYYEVVVMKSGDTIHTSYVSDLEEILFAKTNPGAILNSADAQKKTAGLFTDGLQHNGNTVGKWFMLFSIFLLLVWCIRNSIALKKRNPFDEDFRSLKYYRKKLLPFCVFFRRKIAGTWQRAAMYLAGIMMLSQPMMAEMPPGKNGAGIPVAGEVRYFHANPLGSSTLLTDESGGLANSISYKPFGSIDEKHSIGKDNFRLKFSGKERDENIALDYFGSRYYDSDIGRFISPDPENQYHSPYIYGDDDPLSGIDPDGNFFIPFDFISLIIDAAIIGAYIGASEANHSFNPAKWNWNSSKTWMGMLDGAVSGVAAVVSISAIVLTFGEATPEVIALDEELNLAMAALDSYSFARDRSVMNGITLGLDVVPFIGPLLGRIGKSARVADKVAEDIEMTERDINEAGKVEKDEDAAGEEMACPMSFVAGTPVLLPSHVKPIEEIGVGDLVMAYDPGTGETGAFTVNRIFSRVATGIILLITTSFDTLAVTPNHPFYVENRGEVDAAALKKGDVLTNLPDSYAASFEQLAMYSPTDVKVLNTIFYPDSSVKVYNFEVEKAHTYFVGKDGLLVHNCATKRLAALGKTPGKNSKTGREVFKRMKGKKAARTIAGKKEVYVSKVKGGPKTWVALDANIHMGHIEDAVDVWNNGSKKLKLAALYKSGARSKKARAFMRNSKNYVFEWGALNSSNGAKLKMAYRRPYKWKGKW
jgi:RHS repeat-associated protein